MAASLSSQWASLKQQLNNNISDIVQCPICFEQPTGKVVLCYQGHHVCEPCRSKMFTNRCPICSDNFTGGKLLMLPSIMSEITNIQKSIDKLILDKSKATEQPKASTSTAISTSAIVPAKQLKPLAAVAPTYNIHTPLVVQTPVFAPNFAPTFVPPPQPVNNKKRQEGIGYHLKAVKGLFPCMLNDCCDDDEEFYSSEMINHIREDHHPSQFYIKESIDGETATISWKMSTEAFYECRENSLAVHIRDMELFFLNLSQQGDLFGNVTILSSEENSEKFVYSMAIANESFYGYDNSYSGPMKSCRLKLGRDLFVKQKDINRMLNCYDTLECNVTITRLYD